VASAGAAISGYLTVTALSGAPPVCLAGDCAAVAASPYARFLGVPTATWGLALYVAVGALGAAMAWARSPAPAFSWLPITALGLTAFGVTFSLYLLWIQVAVLHAVCSWCAASDVLWIVLLALILAAVLGSD
jgi:uncharacterized membrane protein